MTGEFAINSHKHDFIADDPHLEGNERRTLWVALITAAMMLVEIVAGYFTSSMALFADGWHMASHTAALMIALFAYRMARSNRIVDKFSFGTGKFIPLGGYTSAIVLGIIALLMFLESAHRLMAPTAIEFDEAIAIACVGLLVNIVSAVILSGGHHGHNHAHDHDHESGEHEHHAHDHNFRSAYLHVLADAVTSVLAIGALTVGKFYSVVWLDPAVGIIGSFVILNWSMGLCKATAWELLDGHARTIDRAKLRRHLEGQGVVVSDLHVWRIAPKATACELVVLSETRRGHDFYRNLVAGKFDISHLIVEEREFPVA